MTTKEIAHIVKPVNMLNGAAYTTTQTSAALDTLGWESAYIVVHSMTWTSGGMFTPSLVECATVGGTYQAPSGQPFPSAVAETSMIEWFLDGVSTGQVVPLLDSVADAAHVIGVSYVGGQQRFLKLVMTASSAPVGTGFGILGFLGHPREVGPKAFSNWNT